MSNRTPSFELSPKAQTALEGLIRRDLPHGHHWTLIAKSGFDLFDDEACTQLAGSCTRETFCLTYYAAEQVADWPCHRIADQVLFVHPEAHSSLCGRLLDLAHVEFEHASTDLGWPEMFVAATKIR